MPGGRSKGEICPRGTARARLAAATYLGRSGLLLLDIVDDLGHVVLVLAEFGGVLDQLLFLFLGFLEWDALFLFFLDLLGFLGLEIGIDVLGADRLQLAFYRRGRPRPAGLYEGFGGKRGGGFCG